MVRIIIRSYRNYYFTILNVHNSSKILTHFQGRGQEPTSIQSTIHYGGLPCCDKHRYTGSGRLWQNVDTTTDFHTYTVEWTPKNMIFKFDGVYKYEININKVSLSLEMS